MPVYCYRNGRHVISRWFPASSHPKEFVYKGRTYRRDYAAEGVGVPGTKGWPLECYASGVAPDQAGELRDYLAKKGVPTEVSADGNPIYRDAAHRKKALKARGLHDKASFY